MYSTRIWLRCDEGSVPTDTCSNFNSSYHECTFLHVCTRQSAHTQCQFLPAKLFIIQCVITSWYLMEGILLWKRTVFAYVSVVCQHYKASNLVLSFMKVMLTWSSSAPKNPCFTASSSYKPDVGVVHNCIIIRFSLMATKFSPGIKIIV